MTAENQLRETLPLQPIERPPPFRIPEPTTLGKWWSQVAARGGDSAAIIKGSQTDSYAQIDKRSRDLAAGMLGLGLGKGARVGLLLPNGTEWVAAWLAVSRIGGIAVALSTFASAHELRYAVRHADCAILLTADSYLRNDYTARLIEAWPELATRNPNEPLALLDCPFLRRIYFTANAPTWSDGTLDTLAGHPDKISFDLLEAIEQTVSPADEALLLYTSGSTADPKAVIHIHAALVDKIVRLATMKSIIPLGTKASDRMLVSNPFFWVGGWISVSVALDVGATVVIEDEHSPRATLDAVRRHGITQISAAPTMLNAITQLPDFKPEDFAAIRIQNTSQWPFFCRNEGKPAARFAAAIGMTETLGPHSGYWYAGELPEGLDGTMGPPLEGMEFRVTNPETGEVLMPGSRGELQVRGIWVMDRFYKRLRSETFTPDGFYPTGDEVTLDGLGRIWFHRRLGGMIKTSGANVSPEEVEVALRSIDEVVEAAVFPLPDPRAGEIVAAAVVLARGSKLDADALRKRLRPLLSTFKVPKQFRFVAREVLPRTPSDKVRRGELARMVEAGEL